jgi:hypothetical protein
MRRMMTTTATTSGMSPRIAGTARSPRPVFAISRSEVYRLRYVDVPSNAKRKAPPCFSAFLGGSESASLAGETHASPRAQGWPSHSRRLVSKQPILGRPVDTGSHPAARYRHGPAGRSGERGVGHGEGSARENVFRRSARCGWTGRGLARRGGACANALRADRNGDVSPSDRDSGRRVKLRDAWRATLASGSWIGHNRSSKGEQRWDGKLIAHRRSSSTCERC